MGLVLVLVLVLLPALATAQMRTVTIESRPTARLQLEQPTVVVFPEVIGGLFIGYSREVLEREQNGHYLALLPHSDVEGILHVVGKSGALYTLPYKTDARPDQVLRLTAGVPQTKTQAVPVTRWSFLRHLRLGTPLPGQQAVDIPLPAITDARLSVIEHGAVRLKDTVGLVLAVQHAESEPLLLDPRVGLAIGEVSPQTIAMQQWGWPPKWRVCGVSVAAAQETPDGMALVEPSVLTRIYVILEPAPQGCQ